jgi:hypothetical protein
MLAVLAGCGDRHAVDTRPLTLGDDCFRVPVASLAFYNAKSRRSAALMFANESVRKAVPGYAIPPALSSGMRDTLFVSVFVPTAPDAARIDADEKVSREENYHDLWYALDEFAARTIEPIDGTTLHRVKPLAGGSTWMVVSRPPDPAIRDAHTATDFWIATCTRIESGPLVRCTVPVARDGLRMTMYTTEANLAIREPLARYVIDSMKPWRVACASGER